MAKQVIIAAMEEVFGEYILNLTKENLKIAAMRGKIKLENVQLDGDLIGSHVLGAVGLTSFGVLSCSAKSIKITVPWKNLGKEATRFEVHGIHLVCVPLTPSTANKRYGSGTKSDPVCSLRTRAKRLVLARFERNFWNGQIPGEGPPMKRITRAVKDAEREMKRSRSRTRRDNKDVDDNGLDFAMHELFADSRDTASDTETEISRDSSFTLDSLPELPRDWKVKLREKVLRNLEASVYDTHIRCEVLGQNSQDINDKSFAIGFTFESLVVRTANEDWEIGRHGRSKVTDERVKDEGIGPNPYEIENNKIGLFGGISLYWDNDPTMLLAETDVFQGKLSLSPEKFVSRVSAAMEALKSSQEPGEVIRKTLSKGNVPPVQDASISHEYICEDLRSEIRSQSSDRTLPGPISCSAHVAPCEFVFHVKPEQLAQYMYLRSSIKSQKRFDTMLRQRPRVSPKDNPQAWWKYAVACVTSRPNSRRWDDIQRITRCRSRYVELVSKKPAKSSGRGFHRGLNDKESAELLDMEDTLPIEALLAFHMIALRFAHEASGRQQYRRNRPPASPSRPLSAGRFPIFSARQKKLKMPGPDSLVQNSADKEVIDPGSKASVAEGTELSLWDAMTLRLGKKTWFVDWKIQDILAKVVVTSSLPVGSTFVALVRMCGSARSFGIGKRDFFFDLTQALLSLNEDPVLFLGKHDHQTIEEHVEYQIGSFDSILDSLSDSSSVRVQHSESGPDLNTPSKYLDLPPHGSVCRIAAGSVSDSFRASVASHPLTLIWTPTVFETVSVLANLADSKAVDIADKIKNAATPLAKKAQLAFLQPSSSSLHLHMASPKVWVPIGAGGDGSAVCFDAGLIQMASMKNKGDMDVEWDVMASELQVNLYRTAHIDRILSGHTRCRPENYVVRPFSVEATRRTIDLQTGICRVFDTTITPVCLNLVDAEVFARSFGKWYARVLRQFGSAGISREHSLLHDHEQNLNKQGLTANVSSMPLTMTVRLEKVEIAIEGHSKRKGLASFDDGSLASFDSTTEVSPTTRTYLMEISHLTVHRDAASGIDRAQLRVEDVTIVRLKDKTLYTPFGTKKDIIDSENSILHFGDTGLDPECVNQTSHVFSVNLIRQTESHLNEVEVEVHSIEMRVTPTTLKDCAKAFKRVAEVVQVATKEMERKVHEAGRKARLKDRLASRSESPTVFMERPLSPSKSDGGSIPQTSQGNSDSSIIFKITLDNMTVLAGRPTSTAYGSSRGETAHYAVIQVLSNALIMFQSIENPDGTGQKTLHVSLDNVSSLVNTEFVRVSPSMASPMIGPFGTEFRVVYGTEKMGCVISQDFSLGCEVVKSHLTPNDLSVMWSISNRLIERLRAFGTAPQQDMTPKDTKVNPMSYLVKYQKKGTGIATSLSMEVHAFSFVLLRTYKSDAGAPEFLDFHVEQVKMKLNGCLSALSGDLMACTSLNFFNSDVDDWEYAVEPFTVLLSIEQMPNELFVEGKVDTAVQLNLTGVMMRDLSAMKFDLLSDNVGVDIDDNPAALSTIGLRTATETRSIHFQNLSGANVIVVLFENSSRSVEKMVVAGSSVELGRYVRDRTHEVRIRLAVETHESLGERYPLDAIPLPSSSGMTSTIHSLRPVASMDYSGANSYLYAEPVVEWCMHNQRLRSTSSDVYSISRGQDLLSSSVWSPEQGNAKADNFEEMEGINWVHPYLAHDAPEWTDLTCTLKLSRDRISLPDEWWIWLNEWTVDIHGKLGFQSDSDGWEYNTDFETFAHDGRSYVRGDVCRRRRWTRVRAIRPPTLTDPCRPLSAMCEVKLEDAGDCNISFRSCTRVINMSPIGLTIYASSPSWACDQLAGKSEPGLPLDIPISLSLATHISVGNGDGVKSELFLIVPTNVSVSNYLRTQLELNDVSGTVFHFLVEVKCESGLSVVTIRPVFKIENLLPCQLDCKVGQMDRSQSRTKDPKVHKTEAFNVKSGGTMSCVAVSPWRKPHLAFRVPGYRWSRWIRLVNRRANSSTWRPNEAESELQLPSKEDSGFADELCLVIPFERKSKRGDPLILILSVECGHCPTLRVYAQYWVLDKSGFGCRFSDGFVDMLGTKPNLQTSRRSFLTDNEERNNDIVGDFSIEGHQWSIGMQGMTMFFSRRERLTLTLEREYGSSSALRTKWIHPHDVSNVMPKTVFSVPELSGTRQFELAYTISTCSGPFNRTRLITLLPRYQIINLLHREVVVSQDLPSGNLTTLPSQSTVSLHWEDGSLASRIRIGAPSLDEKARGRYNQCLSPGALQVDRIGITSMRLPSSNGQIVVPMVVQAEVRLATKHQDSAVVVVLWSATEKSNPLYMIRNKTKHTILSRQSSRERLVKSLSGNEDFLKSCANDVSVSGFECGGGLRPAIQSFLGIGHASEFVWILKDGEQVCFGFEYPENDHVIEWTCVMNSATKFHARLPRAFLELDTMGSSSFLVLPEGIRVCCSIRAEHSTKVIEFVEVSSEMYSLSNLSRLQSGLLTSLSATTENATVDDEDDVAFGLRFNINSILVSFIDNADPLTHGSEILLLKADRAFLSFCKTREGNHEYEATVMTFQVDNHVHKSIHPLLIFCPQMESSEPLLHLSAVRNAQSRSTMMFRYAAFRLLEFEVYLDRRTAEKIALFCEPFTKYIERHSSDSITWVKEITESMDLMSRSPDHRAPRNLEDSIHLANSGRIYVEQLHLHPVKIRLTFTQEWMEWHPGTEAVMMFQFIRGMASIANAPLMFNSFVVGHVFEAPQTLLRVIATHYSSQLTKQIFGILGSLAILGAPADFFSNVGTGVRDFFYEPIQGAVHGPKQFIEGLEAGTESLARGVFVGVVRGAANVTEVVNANLAGLTADDDFIDERRAHQRMMTDAMSRGKSRRSFGDSLYLAGTSFARSVKSGVFGIVEQPSMYASRHGPVGLVKGIGKALVGAVVKPVVGVGDAAVLVMNHMSDATSKKKIVPKIPIRIRRALPCRSTKHKNYVQLIPFDERAAKAQKIVTGGESLDDVYLGHVDIPNHLIIAKWEEVSHFVMMRIGVRLVVFSQSGLRTYVFQTESARQSTELEALLLLQSHKMANAADVDSKAPTPDTDRLSHREVPGVKSKQIDHVFGTLNNTRRQLDSSIQDEADLVEQSYSRIRVMKSSSTTFFKDLDEEAWNLVSSWGQVFSGLSSRRCIVASVINGTGCPLQIKSTKLLQGGSPCYTMPTQELDAENGVLQAGGAVVFFAWGVSPSLLQAGNVLMHIHTNGFVSELADHKSRSTFCKATPGFQVGFLEKSYDDAGWWAKYWVLVRKETGRLSYHTRSSH